MDKISALEYTKEESKLKAGDVKPKNSCAMQPLQIKGKLNRDKICKMLCNYFKSMFFLAVKLDRRDHFVPSMLVITPLLPHKCREG